MIEDELIFDASKDGQMAEEDVINACREKWPVAEFIVDPSATPFIRRVNSMGLKAFKANNDVMAGIYQTNNCLASGRLKLSAKCKYLLKEAASYIWNKNQLHSVVKKRDHACDAKRYGVMHVMPDNAAQVTDRL